MMGLCLQCSWVILNTTSLLLSPLYVFSGPLFRLLDLSEEVASASERLSLYMIPQLFTNALYFPTTNFLLSQSKMAIMVAAGVVVLGLHMFFIWMLILRLDWGLRGAAVALNASYLLIVVAQLSYILRGIAVGVGWQALVAYANIACLYVFGLPLDILMGYKLDFGVKFYNIFSSSLNDIVWESEGNTKEMRSSRSNLSSSPLGPNVGCKIHE